MLANEIDFILPTFPKDKRHKRSIIRCLIIGFIGLAYKEISSFLHHKCQKALKKAATVMERKADIQHSNCNCCHALYGNKYLDYVSMSTFIDSADKCVLIKGACV